MLLEAPQSGTHPGGSVLCYLPVKCTACVLLQGKLEPTSHSFRQLVSLPLPDPDILQSPARVQGAVPQERSSASPGPAALPASQAQCPDITALSLLADCAEVGSLQPVLLCLHACPCRRGCRPEAGPCCRTLSRATANAAVLDVCQCVSQSLQGMQQQEQPALMAASSQAAETVSGGGSLMQPLQQMHLC